MRETHTQQRYFDYNVIEIKKKEKRVSLVSNKNFIISLFDVLLYSHQITKPFFFFFFLFFFRLFYLFFRNIVFFTNICEVGLYRF